MTMTVAYRRLKDWEHTYQALEDVMVMVMVMLVLFIWFNENIRYSYKG